MENLYECPMCERKGFTEPGLRAHRCKQMNGCPLHAEVVDQIVAPGGLDRVVDGLLANTRRADRQRTKKRREQKSTITVSHGGNRISFRGPIANAVFESLAGKAKEGEQ